MKTAIAMSERAARIEPTNRAYWKPTAGLGETAGQHDRVNAIRLQWLTRRRFRSEKLDAVVKHYGRIRRKQDGGVN